MTKTNKIYSIFILSPYLAFLALIQILHYVYHLYLDEGIKKEDLSRDEFLKNAWDWKEKHGGIILEQLKKLGASCDWKRTKFTMDDDMNESVINVFIDLYNKGLIYRGVRMVN